jgi:hypothetical protein
MDVNADFGDLPKKYRDWLQKIADEAVEESVSTGKNALELFGERVNRPNEFLERSGIIYGALRI